MGWDDFGYDEIDFPDYTSFSPSNYGFQQIPSYIPPPRQQPQRSKFEDFLDSIRPQESPNLDIYTQHLAQTPRREDYQVGKLAKILGGIGAFGIGLRDPQKGYDFAQGIVNRPYNQAVQDWSLKEEGLRNAANVDIKDIQQQNTFLSNLMKAQGALQALESKEAIAAGKEIGATRRTELTVDQKREAAKQKSDTDIKIQEMENQGLEITGRYKVRAAQVGAGSRENVARITAEQKQRSDETEAEWRQRVAEINASKPSGSRSGTVSNPLLGRAAAESYQNMLPNPKYRRLIEEGIITPKMTPSGQDTGEFIMHPDSDALDDPDDAKLFKEFVDEFYGSTMGNYKKYSPGNIETPRITPPTVKRPAVGPMKPPGRTGVPNPSANIKPGTGYGSNYGGGTRTTSPPRKLPSGRTYTITPLPLPGDR